MKAKYERIKSQYGGLYLFTRNMQNDIMYWTADVEDSEKAIRFYYGRVDVSFYLSDFRSKRVITSGKNIGRSNETSILEQAYSELESEYKSQIKKGYKPCMIDDKEIRIYHDIYNNITSDLEISTLRMLHYYLKGLVEKTKTDANGLIKPMKCQPFELDSIKYPAIAQPKYNGCRTLIHEDISRAKDIFDQDSSDLKLTSKEGLDHYANHLKTKIQQFCDSIRQVSNIKFPFLDGELYIPDIPVTTISGAARNIKNPYNSKLQYVIFDLALDTIPQIARDKILKDALKYHNSVHLNSVKIHVNSISIPDLYVSYSKVINNDEEAVEFLELCLSKGYEGIVVREMDAEYAFGSRPRFIQKLKKFKDSEFKILDIEEYGDFNDPVGYGVKLILQNDLDDGNFKSTLMGDAITKHNIFINKDLHIGKDATVKFYERTVFNKPFHSNTIRINEFNEHK